MEKILIKEKYGSDAYGESKDSDVVYCIKKFRIDECEKIIQANPDEDIIIIGKNNNPCYGKYNVYPKTNIPHILLQCVNKTTSINLTFNNYDMYKLENEIIFLFKDGIEAILEGEYEKGMFKLLQFLAFKKMKFNDTIIDKFFYKTGLIELNGCPSDTYNFKTKSFNIDNINKIIHIACSMVGEPVTIELRKLHYIKYCINPGEEHDYGDYNVSPKTNEIEADFGEKYNLRDIMKWDENNQFKIFNILKNKNIEIVRNTDIKIKLFGATRWGI